MASTYCDKQFPLDVMNEKGSFSRAYVLDVEEDGRTLLHFGFPHIASETLPTAVRVLLRLKNLRFHVAFLQVCRGLRLNQPLLLVPFGILQIPHQQRIEVILPDNLGKRSPKGKPQASEPSVSGRITRNPFHTHRQRDCPFRTIMRCSIVQGLKWWENRGT